MKNSSGAWVDSTYDLSAYAGKTVLFRYRYATDGESLGFEADQVRRAVDPQGRMVNPFLRRIFG